MSDQSVNRWESTHPIIFTRAPIYSMDWESLLPMENKVLKIYNLVKLTPIFHYGYDMGVRMDPLGIFLIGQPV